METENKIQTILTLNGKRYSVQSPPGWVLEPADIERAKQDILSGKIRTLNPATCPDVIQGTTHAVTLTATGGVPDYTYRLLLDGSQIATAGPIAGTSQTFDYKFDQAVGAHILKGEITDSCSTPQTSSDQCATFNIIAAVGSISCTTTPSGASVALDDVSQGVVTPVTLTDVTPGSHTVTFTLTGYNACPVTVSVTAGATATASCTLCIIPSCEFTWAPLNPVINQDITFTASDTTLIAHNWKVNDFQWDTAASTTMQITTPGTHNIQHDGTNSCGATCTMTKQIVVACSPLGITMNIT